MAVTTYTLDQYVEDLRRITAETQDDHVIMERVRPLSQRLALFVSAGHELRTKRARAHRTPPPHARRSPSLISDGPTGWGRSCE